MIWSQIAVDPVPDDAPHVWRKENKTFKESFDMTANAASPPVPTPNTANPSTRYAEEVRSQRPTGDRRSRGWSRRSKLLLIVILVMVLGDILAALLLGMRMYALDRQNRELRVKLTQTESELQQLTPTLQTLRDNLDILVRGKLPRLRELVYDQVLPLGGPYLKNVTFTEIVRRDAHIHEFKLVVQNNTPAPLWPEVQLYLFDAFGVQIGSAEIGTPNPAALKTESLGAGETRSYTAPVQLWDATAKPVYFLVRTPRRGTLDASTTPNVDR